MGERFKLGAIGISLYLIATGLSYAVFSMVLPGESKNVPQLSSPTPAAKQGRFAIDPTIPRTEPCPINGKLFTKQEKDVWVKRRPLTVMIENHEEARPQSGLSAADVIYESVAEGGITRFMGVFYCGVAGGAVSFAPVRSARIYYLPWVLEYDGLYNHVGGAGKCDDPTVDEKVKALCRIEQWKIKDMDQFGISFPTCYRNYDRLGRTVATEHTMVCVSDKLYKVAEQRGWTNVDAKNVAWDKNFVQWKFKDDAKDLPDTASPISYVAWKGYEKGYGVRWEYDKATNSYLRFTGDLPHKDLETEEQLSTKVFIVQFAKQTGPVDEHMHLYYENIGSGDALIFQDGKMVKGKWKKTDKSARTIFTDDKNKEVQFNRGLIWIDMLPIGTDVSS